MTDFMQPVTGTSSIVGFAHGGHGGNHYNPGISDKDQGYAHAVDLGEQTRDVLHGQRFSDEVNARQHTESQVATEKNGEAAVLTTERNAAVLQVQGERNVGNIAAQAERIATAQANRDERIAAAHAERDDRNNLAQIMAASDARLEQAKQHCEILAKIEKCCCEQTATMREIEATRVRDDLAQCRAELIASKSGPGNSGFRNN